MRYFELLKRIYNNGSEVGPRGLQTKEILGAQLTVDNYNFFACPEHRSLVSVTKYVYGELAWYLSGDRDITNILPYSKFWESIRNADNTANSNYGDLVFYRKNSKGITSFDWALECLKKDRETRKAIVLYNDRELFYHESKDLVCNQFQHFLIRDNKLICFVSLRSSDAIMGLQFNAPWWSLVHQQMRLRLLESYPDLELGPITAFIDSCHIYQNKYQLVENILNSTQKYYWLAFDKVIPLHQKFEWYRENLHLFMKLYEVSK